MNTSSTDTLLVSRDGPIATVTINRPEKLNAINTATARAMSDAFEKLSADDDLRVVVLRGAGDRAFGVGADISEFKDVRNSPDQARQLPSSRDCVDQGILHRRQYGPAARDRHAYCR
jgi:enoyl-CoA hydratase